MMNRREASSRPRPPSSRGRRLEPESQHVAKEAAELVVRAAKSPPELLSRNVPIAMAVRPSLKRKEEEAARKQIIQLELEQEKATSVKTRATTNPSSHQEASRQPQGKQQHRCAKSQPELPNKELHEPERDPHKNYLYWIGIQKRKNYVLFQTLNGSTNDCFLCMKKKGYRDVVRENLNKKYLTSREAFGAKTIGDLLCAEPCHLVAVFNDYAIYDNPAGNLRRFYGLRESRRKVARAATFYSRHCKVYANYFVLPEKSMLFHNIAQKLHLLKDSESSSRGAAPQGAHMRPELGNISIESRIFTTRFLSDLNHKSRTRADGSRNSVEDLLNDFIAKDSLSLLDFEACKPEIDRMQANFIVAPKKISTNKAPPLPPPKLKPRCRHTESAQDLLSADLRLQLVSPMEGVQSRNLASNPCHKAPRRAASCAADQDEEEEERRKRMMTVFATVQKFVGPLTQGKSLLRAASNALRERRRAKSARLGRRGEPSRVPRAGLFPAKSQSRPSAAGESRNKTGARRAESVVPKRKPRKTFDIDIGALNRRLQKMETRKKSLSEDKTRLRSQLVSPKEMVMGDKKGSVAGPRVAKLEFPRRRVVHRK